MSRALPLAILVLLGTLVGAGGGATFGAFSSGTANPANDFTADRIYLGGRATTAWDVTDAANGTPVDASDPVALDDGKYLTTKSWPVSFSADNYIELDLASPLPDGLVASGAAFELAFADERNQGGDEVCFYFDVRRASTGTVIGTHGGPGAPIACQNRQTVLETSTPLPEVTSSEIGNDLRIRVYAAHSRDSQMRLHRAAATFGYFGHTWALNEVRLDDRADGTSASSPWSLAFADGDELQTSSWATSFAAGRYLELRFPPDHVPSGAYVNGGTLTHRYRPQAAGRTFCYWLEVYSGPELLAGHGSPGSPLACSSSGSPSTETTDLPEIDAGADADNLAVRIYGRSTPPGASLHDQVRLDVDYGLAAGGCTAPGSQTVYATRDSWLNEQVPTQNQGAADQLRVKTRNGGRNRRAVVGFDLPPIPTGCSLRAATLRMHQIFNQGGPRPLEALRLDGAWTEGGVNWANQPPTAGAAATTTAGSGWREWDVRTQAAAMYSTANHGFLIRDADEGSTVNDEQRFDSRETASPPELILEFDG